jgi:hypothetical protein
VGGLRQVLFDDDDDSDTERGYVEVVGSLDTPFPGFSESSPTTALRRQFARQQAHLPLEVDTRVDRLLGISGGVYDYEFGFDVVSDDAVKVVPTGDSKLTSFIEPATRSINDAVPTPQPARSVKGAVPTSEQYMGPPEYSDDSADPVDSVDQLDPADPAVHHTHEGYTLAQYQRQKHPPDGVKSINYDQPPVFGGDDMDDTDTSNEVAEAYVANVSLAPCTGNYASLPCTLQTDRALGYQRHP